MTKIFEHESHTHKKSFRHLLRRSQYQINFHIIGLHLKRAKNSTRSGQKQIISKVTEMSEEQLNFILKTLMNEVDGIQSVALVSREGLIVNSILEEDVSPMHIAAMSAIILSTCERVLLEFKKGELDICIIQGTEGKFICMECGEDFILVCVLQEDARMDILFTKMRLTVNKVVDLTEE